MSHKLYLFDIRQYGSMSKYDAYKKIHYTLLHWYSHSIKTLDRISGCIIHSKMHCVASLYRIKTVQICIMNTKIQCKHSHQIPLTLT